MVDPEVVIGGLTLLGGSFAYTVRLALKLGEEKKAREIDAKVIEKISAKNEDIERRVNSLEQFEAGTSAKDTARSQEMERIYDALSKMETSIKEVNEKLTQLTILFSTKKD